MLAMECWLSHWRFPGSLVIGAVLASVAFVLWESIRGAEHKPGLLTLGIFIWSEFGFTSLNPAIGASGHHIGSKSAIDITPFLLHDHSVREKSHRDSALSRVARNKTSDVSFDNGFASCVTRMPRVIDRAPLAFELHFELVVRESEDAKFIVRVTVDSVNLCSFQNFRGLGRASQNSLNQ
jgi:hypothetical protein